MMQYFNVHGAGMTSSLKIDIKKLKEYLNVHYCPVESVNENKVKCYCKGIRLGVPLLIRNCVDTQSSTVLVIAPLHSTYITNAQTERLAK